MNMRKDWWKRLKFGFLGIAIAQPINLGVLGFTWAWLFFGLLFPIILLIVIDLLVCGLVD